MLLNVAGMVLMSPPTTAIPLEDSSIERVTMTAHSISVEVRAVIDNGYRLKVSVTDLGLYMDGFRATHSDKNISGWWVQPPARLAGKKWLQMPEFDKSLTLWREIEQAITDVVNEEERGVSTNGDIDYPTPPTLEEVGRVFPDSEVIPT